MVRAKYPASHTTVKPYSGDYFTGDHFVVTTTVITDSKEEADQIVLALEDAVAMKRITRELKAL